MKISRIEYSNFRNFKEPGAVDFCTDGRVTIVYGVNGAGKTTFHQLFQWILYGQTHFNKTASQKMYNLSMEKEAKINEQFSVVGSILFEHAGEEYLMRREWIYIKTLFEIKTVNKTFTISIKDAATKDWQRLDHPQDLVEQLMPSGLADYFFFDGENMITELKAKSKDSANALKEALYLLLDLSIYAKAVDYIGKIDARTTVLGTLYDGKISDGSNADLVTWGQKKESAEISRDALVNKDQKLANDIKECEARIKEISEQIGSAKSQREYEAQRQSCKERAQQYCLDAEREFELFGDELISSVPKLMMAKSIEKASLKLKKQAQESKLIPGVSKELVDALMESDCCVCGRPLTEDERSVLRELYEHLPPKGYDSLYRNFTDLAERWGKEYDRKRFEAHIINALRCLENERSEYETIQDIDKQMQSDQQYEALVVERKKREEDIKSLREQKEALKEELYKAKLLVNKCIKEINRLSSSITTNVSIDRKIKIMEAVQKHFEELLDEKSLVYSQKLEANIQNLVAYMLEAERTVTVTPDFVLKVVDDFNDESKSEGQFATVSFAYIGGIFKLLKDEEILSNKEYPLVLDAPFSKLGEDPRQKVIDTIPDYAPQIILLSKDDIQDCFADGKIGKVYTIKTNKTQNIATIEEGFLWT